MWSQSKSPGLSCEAAVLPRSGTPTAPRMPKPRSVKLSPLRTVRPIPSSSRQRMKSVATPPCMMKSSTRWPTSLSTKAVQTAVFRRKHFRSPREVLYSPPPSQARNSRAVRTRPSPGSRRSITSPREIWSKPHEAAGLIGRLMVEGSRAKAEARAPARRFPVGKIGASGRDVAALRAEWRRPCMRSRRETRSRGARFMAADGGGKPGS